MKSMRILITIAIAVLVTSQSFAQLTPWKPFSFLEEKVIDELIGEMSGERAMKHLLELYCFLSLVKSDSMNIKVSVEAREWGIVVHCDSR